MTLFLSSINFIPTIAYAGLSIRSNKYEFPLVYRIYGRDAYIWESTMIIWMARLGILNFLNTIKESIPSPVIRKILPVLFNTVIIIELREFRDDTYVLYKKQLKWNIVCFRDINFSVHEAQSIKKESIFNYFRWTVIFLSL